MKKIGIALIVLFMVGCSSNKSTTVYSYSAPTSPDGQVCVDECKESKNRCDTLCTVASPQCLAKEQQQARNDFSVYEHEQQAAGQPVTQSLLSFYHPEKCDHTGCGCEENYKVCYQLCGTRTEVHDAIAEE